MEYYKILPYKKFVTVSYEVKKSIFLIQLTFNFFKQIDTKEILF